MSPPLFNSRWPISQKGHVVNATKITLTTALFLAALAPAAGQSYHGITCDDVRALTAAERDFWSSHLNLSAGQRHAIEATCLQNHRRGRGHTVGLSEEVGNK
jgi:hypothetical protein